MAFTVHSGADRLRSNLQNNNEFVQIPLGSLESSRVHSATRRKVTITRLSSLRRRDFENTKLWSTYRPRGNIFIVRAINEGGNAIRNGNGKENGKEDLTLTRVWQAFGRAVDRIGQKFQRQLKEETGIDIEQLQERITDSSRRVEEYKQQGIQNAEKLRFQLWPRFLAWNQLERWKDFKHWESRRIVAFVLYVLAVAVSFQGLFLAFKRSRVYLQPNRRLAEGYLEAFIPDPSPRNVRELKKGLWRRYMPEGLKVNKYYLGPDGAYHHSKDYVGQDAWDDDSQSSQLELEKVNDEDDDSNEEQKQELKKDLGLRAGEGRRQVTVRGTWQERLAKWEDILEKEKWQEDIDALTSKYVITFDWQQMKENYRKEQEEKSPDNHRGRWITKRWWQYRPKLPYTYFLLKVESLEVKAAVFSEDFKKIYVTMKEGFPSEYIVDIPVDPYLFELLTRCGVEVDILHTTHLHYIVRAFAVLAPGFFILWCIERALYTMNIVNKNLLVDIAKSNNEIMILPGEAEDGAASGYSDVVLGGDVWDLLNEIMIYMKNPLRYYKKRVKIPRGILISGPPGTGKTLLARAIARESGLPFVFASGAEFAESGTKSGSQKIFELFFTARANAPSFIFIDEVDALAGKHANDDPERKSTFEQLLSQLDGEEDNTNVERYSLRQAVILICATNRPDELDEKFLQPGRIDRELHVGLPGEKDRVSIFSVHSQGKRLAKDVDFKKLVFRTIGYSGADIRNLVNESGIMAVRKGHNEISQQDIIDVLDKQLFESMGLVLTDDEQQMYEKTVTFENKRLLAVHEAGHILLAHLFPQFDWHAFTHLLPGGKESALSVFYPREDMVQMGYPTVGYLKMQMVVAHGGRCAEQLIFGDDITDGGRDDLARISSIARELVISPANPRLGLFRLTWNCTYESPFHNQEGSLIKNEWEKPGTEIAQMSVELSELFTREVTRYIEETEEDAKNALRRNRHIFDRLTAELLERTKLSGMEVEEIVKSMNPVMMSDLMQTPNLNLGNMAISAPPNFRGYYEDLDIYPAPLHRC